MALASSSSSLFSLSLPKKLVPNSLTTAVKASTTTTSTPPAPEKEKLESLNDRFSRKGIKFSESSNDNQNSVPLVELTVRNGSSLRLQIPNAHVTSYKPKVHWKDDGFEEVLYTTTAATAGAGAKGGIALVLNDVSAPPPTPPNYSKTKTKTSASTSNSLLSASQWTVKDVDSDAIDALQV